MHGGRAGCGFASVTSCSGGCYVVATWLLCLRVDVAYVLFSTIGWPHLWRQVLGGTAQRVRLGALAEPLHEAKVRNLDVTLCRYWQGTRVGKIGDATTISSTHDHTNT